MCDHITTHDFTKNDDLFPGAEVDERLKEIVESRKVPGRVDYYHAMQPFWEVGQVGGYNLKYFAT